MAPKQTSPKSAWTQLYQARQHGVDAYSSRQPGRPPSPVPRRKVGMTLSQGEITELDVWQERLSGLMGRKISVGETVGIITRICSARFARLDEGEQFESLADLVERLIGE